MVKYTFKKEERLCNKRFLANLFQSGSSFVFYPYRISFLKSSQLPSPAQVVISVPKRRFKKAVDRNLLKRRMREAYRLHKAALLYTFLTENESEVLLAIQYIGKEMLDFDLIFNRMENALRRFQHEYTKHYLGKRD